MRMTAEQNLAKAERQVALYSRRVKLATTCLKRWERKRNYYQKVVSGIIPTPRPKSNIRPEPRIRKIDFGD